MEAFVSLAHGLTVAIQPMNLLFALIGVLLGTAVGVLPGIGPALTVALLLPITFKLDPAARSSCSPASITAACMAARPPRS